MLYVLFKDYKHISVSDSQVLYLTVQIMHKMRRLYSISIYSSWTLWINQIIWSMDSAGLAEKDRIGTKCQEM